MPIEADALLLATNADDLTHVLAQQRDGRKNLRAEAKATRGQGRGRGRAPAKSAQPVPNAPEAAGPQQNAPEAAEPRQDGQPEEAVSEATAKRVCKKRAEPQQDSQPKEAASKAKAKRVCEKPGDTEERPSKSAKKPPLDQVWPILHAASRTI